MLYQSQSGCRKHGNPRGLGVVYPCQFASNKKSQKVSQNSRHIEMEAPFFSFKKRIYVGILQEEQHCLQISLGQEMVLYGGFGRMEGA